MFKKYFIFLFMFILIIGCSKKTETVSEQKGQADVIEKQGTSVRPEIKITSIKKYGESGYTIVLNNSIIINDVQIKQGKSGDFVAWPSEKYKDKYRTYVYVMDRGFNDYVLESIKNNKTEKISGSSGKGLEITDIRISKYERGKLKGFVSFTINDVIELKSFKLFDGRDGLWLASPAKKIEDEFGEVEYKSIIELTGKFKYKAQDAVLSEYRQQR